MGAEVIKVESGRRPDLIRGPAQASPHSGYYPENLPGERPWNRHGYFNERNRNKLGICLDLGLEAGRAVLRDLVRVSDVILDNFSVGVKERLGFGPAAVRALNPAIVSISMSALGETGPEAGYTAYGATIDSLSGLVSVTGYGPDEPENLGINISDPVSGLHGCVAVLAALGRRLRTGLGGHIDLSQLESSIRFFAHALIDYSLNGRVAGPAGNDDPTALLQGVFPCAPLPPGPDGAPGSKDQWLALTIPDRRAWGAVKAVLELEVVDEAGLLSDRAALGRRIAERTVGWTATDLMVALQRRGVPAGAVHDAPRLFADAQLRHRRFFERITHPEAGMHDYIGLAWKSDGQPRLPARPAPRLGEHTDYVLGSILGYLPDRVARLAESGVTANDPRNV
jgi:crotonobetainyl-CoA:carnitine CoA-transferase CaiB-like acyl-CoA transferase